MPTSKGSRGAALKSQQTRDAINRRLSGAARNASAPDTFENRGALRTLDAAKKKQAMKAASTAPMSQRAIQRRLTSGPEIKVSEYDKNQSPAAKAYKSKR